MTVNSFRLHVEGRAAYDAMLAAVDAAASCVLLEMYIFAGDATGREVRDRLAAAALRGVDVQVLVDAWGPWTTPDSFWGPLRAAGGAVRLFRPIRRGLFPFRNHRKLLLVDDRVAFVGGLNVAGEYRGGRPGELPCRDFLLETDLLPSVDELKPNADLHYVVVRREKPGTRRVEA